MVENKYVQKVLDNMNAVPTFPVGSMAKFRQNGAPINSKHSNKMVMIIDYPDKVAGAAKGAIPVIVLPVGTSETVETEVRWLKKARGCKWLLWDIGAVPHRKKRPSLTTITVAHVAVSTSLSRARRDLRAIATATHVGAVVSLGPGKQKLVYFMFLISSFFVGATP